MIRRGLESTLSQCGKKWGKDIKLSGASQSELFVGNHAWIETAVDGVIGLHGNEPGSGPGLVIQDVENSNIEILWTSGLIGCMCLAIQGKTADGKLDVFFCHARKYDEKNAEVNPDNPIKLARDFIQTHKEIRIFWGTDFNVGIKDGSGPATKAHAQKLLSNKLGCWVRSIDCVVSKELVFLPKLGIIKGGSPVEVYKWAISNNLLSKVEFSTSKSLSTFRPDPVILNALEQHITQLNSDLKSWFRLYFLDSRRENKTTVLNEILDAYKVGNFDVLKYYARYAITKDSPFMDASTKNTWAALNESVTAKLVISAYDDALAKIRTMGDNGCGLRADGNDIHNEEEYIILVKSSQLSSSSGLLSQSSGLIK